jgi:glycosyltransferase involved in cell wall biosynthesis
VSLLRREEWQQFSQRGRQFVVENFTWEQSAARLESIMEQARGERTAG